MTRTDVPDATRRLAPAPLGVGLAAALLLVASCSGDPPTPGGTSSGSVAASAAPTSASPTGSATASPTPTPTKAPPASISPVLPTRTNPITNTSTVKALAIDKVLVEDNVAEGGGGDAPDHLEVTLRNTGSAALTAFEVFYTISDPKTKDTESYYVRLPDSFTIAAGARRVAHFDGTKGTDHFPVNKFSLYYTDRNALDVSVLVSAVDAAPATARVKKDAGGAEEAD